MLFSFSHLPSAGYSFLELCGFHLLPAVAQACGDVPRFPVHLKLLCALSTSITNYIAQQCYIQPLFLV